MLDKLKMIIRMVFQCLVLLILPLSQSGRDNLLYTWLVVSYERLYLDIVSVNSELSLNFILICIFGGCSLWKFYPQDRKKHLQYFSTMFILFTFFWFWYVIAFSLEVGLLESTESIASFSSEVIFTTLSREILFFFLINYLCQFINVFVNTKKERIWNPDIQVNWVLFVNILLASLFCFYLEFVGIFLLASCLFVFVTVLKFQLNFFQRMWF
jgi:hypothetical protein